MQVQTATSASTAIDTCATGHAKHLVTVGMHMVQEKRAEHDAPQLEQQYVLREGAFL